MKARRVAAGKPELTHVGHFRIERLLGEGGIGRVYEALDEDLGRMVALKALRPEVSRDPGFVERFRAEAASLARLSHPNITTLYALHREDRDLYMVMELVNGYTLEDIMAHERQLGVDAVRALAGQAAAGLGYAHRMGVIHRDIKPANLMLTESGQLKIMDFGIARIRGSQRLTRAGNIIGTLAYMPPEQIKGAENDERSDIYSLGCVLYEMVCGTHAFSAGTEYDLIQAQIGHLPPLPRLRCPDVDSMVETAIMRSLAKAPGERFDSVPEFAIALGTQLLGRDPADVARDTIVRVGAMTRQQSACPPQPANPPQPATRAMSPSLPAAAPRRWKGLPSGALMLLGVAAVLAAGVVAIVAHRSTPPPEDAAAPTATGAPLAVETVPHSRSILPAPDADAHIAASTLPACPPEDGDQTDVQSGHVDSVTESGWPQIAGTVISLYGVQGLHPTAGTRLSTWLTEKGSELICCPMPQGKHRCLTKSSHQDVSVYLLVNGLARSTDGVPQNYLDAEQKARDAQRGVWK